LRYVLTYEVKTILQNLIDTDIIEVKKTRIEFRPFINSCNQNEIIIENTNDDAIKDFDYLLFMVPSECIQAAALSPVSDYGCPSIDFINLIQLDSILNEKGIDKEEAIRISNKINDISCPESWYKKGNLKMVC
jgi:hypothetical protein